MDVYRDRPVLIIDSNRKKSNSTNNRTSRYNRNLRVMALECLPPLHLDRKKITKWLFDRTRKLKQTNQKKDAADGTGSGIDFRKQIIIL